MPQPHIEMNNKLSQSEDLRDRIAYALNHNFASRGVKLVAHGVGDWMNHPSTKCQIEYFPIDEYGHEVKSINGYRQSKYKIHIDDGTGEHKCDRICRIEDGLVKIYIKETGKLAMTTPLEPDSPTPEYQWKELIIVGQNIKTNAVEVNEVLREYVKKIRVNTTTKISNDGITKKIPNYLPRIAEWYGAIAMNEQETDGYWITTDLRDTTHPRFGDLRGKKHPTWSGKTLSDYYQMAGYDLSYHPNNSTTLSGSMRKGIDVKADYYGHKTDRVPVECLEFRQYKRTKESEYIDKGWIHNNPDIDILYIVDTEAYLVTKKALKELMAQYPRHLYPQRYIKNDFKMYSKSPDVDLYKVNFYVYLDELVSLASHRYTLPSDYLELIQARTKSLVNGNYTTNPQYRFLEHCNPSIEDLSSLREEAKVTGNDALSPF